MEKGFYISYGTKGAFSGVNKKIKAQIKALSSDYDVSSIVIEKEKTNIIKSIMWRLPFGSWGANYKDALKEIADAVNEETVKFFYVRSRPVDGRYLGFLKDLKTAYPDSLIIYEIPTFPYSHELFYEKTMWPWLVKDGLRHNCLRKYVDRIATFSRDEEIFGVPTIRIKNGIDISEICEPQLVDEKKNSSDDVINLIAVAQFQKAHGYERIIRSLKEYVDAGNSPKVTVNLVGDGDERKYYESLTKHLGLEEYIFFHGLKTGSELEELYRHADVALATFGSYKRNIFLSSALKVREYLAHGLPVVSGVTEDVFEDDRPDFFLEFPNDSSAINMKSIVYFYEKLCAKYGTTELHKCIYEYAKKSDMSVTMKPVIEYIKERH